MLHKLDYRLHWPVRVNRNARSVLCVREKGTQPLFVLVVDIVNIKGSVPFSGLEPGNDDDGDDANDDVWRRADAYSNDLLEGTFFGPCRFLCCRFDTEPQPQRLRHP